MAQYETVYGQITRRIDEREHYHERSQRAEAEGVVLDVYVPEGAASIIPGSGVVGSRDIGRTFIVIDFEGNKFGSENMRSWAEKVFHAAGRHVCCYPTVARMTVSPSMVRKIGTYDVATDRIHLEDAEALKAWIGAEDYAELAITKEGTVLTDAAMRKLAKEAERGYDPARFRQRSPRSRR